MLPRARELTTLENQFVSGVAANVRRFASGLCRETTGADKRSVHTLLKMDEAQRLYDVAAVAGLEGSFLTEAPVNTEIWLAVRSRLSRRPGLLIGVKSLCGSGVLAEAGAEIHVARELDRFRSNYRAVLGRKGVSFAKNLAAVLAVLVPAGFDDTHGVYAGDAESERLFVFHESPGGADGGIAAPAGVMGWEAWRALCPTSYEERLAKYEAALLGAVRAAPRYDVIPLEMVREAWGIKEEMFMPLLRAIAEREGGQIALAETSSGEPYVKLQKEEKDMSVISLLERLLQWIRGGSGPSHKASLHQKIAKFKQQLNEIQVSVQKSQQDVLRLSDLLEMARQALSETAAEFGAHHPRTLFATTNVQKMEEQFAAAKRHWHTLEDREKVVRQMIEAIEIKQNRALPVSEEEVRNLTDEAAFVMQEHEALMDSLDDSNRLIQTMAESQDTRFQRLHEATLAAHLQPDRSSESGDREQARDETPKETSAGTERPEEFE